MTNPNPNWLGLFHVSLPNRTRQWQVSFTHPEQQWIDVIFGSIMGKVLGQKVAGIVFRRDIFKADNASSNGFSAAVVRQGIPAFGQC